MTRRPGVAGDAFPMDPSELATWLRVRRYAVPGWMIEAAGRCRAAGDWRGACAAAHVDVDLDLDRIGRKFGARLVERLTEDLRQLVPDLVRWHAPRALSGLSSLAKNHVLVLARYQESSARHGAVTLRLETPRTAHGPQRLTLVCSLGPYADKSADRGSRTVTVVDWTELRHLWNSRYTGYLRQRLGGDRRTPFFHPDGTALTAEELPTGPAPTSPAAHTEWVSGLVYQRSIEPFARALADAGFEVSRKPLKTRWGFTIDPLQNLRPLRLAALTCLDTEFSYAFGGRHDGRSDDLVTQAKIHLGEGWYAQLTRHRRERTPPMAISLVEHEQVKKLPELPEGHWRQPVDLHLLRQGRITPAQLHPLVRQSLFPAWAGPAGLGESDQRRGTAGCGAAAGTELPAFEPVRVRCGSQWHQVSFRDGRLAAPHTPQEHERENALRALGGPGSGCFAVRRRVAGGPGQVPWRLREQIVDLFERALHGDLPAVLRLLDAGIDPAVRGSRGRTLLHTVHLFDDPEPLLSRLLASGLEIDALDQDSRPPLHVAIAEFGSPATIRALLAAGARTDIAEPVWGGLPGLVRYCDRADLDFLVNRPGG